MMTEVEAMREAEARGMILRTLKEDYIQEMTSLRSLGHALDSMGFALSPADLDRYLVYLCQQGYVRCWRAKEMPSYRADRRGLGWSDPNVLVFCKLLPLGLQLVDGDIAADPKVVF